MKMIDFVKAVIIFWALVFIIMALAHAQTPSCVGKHTAREQCACLGWTYDATHDSCHAHFEGVVIGSSADPCGLPAVLHANGKCYQSYTVTKPSPKAVCVYADHGSTATIKCSWKPKGK